MKEIINQYVVLRERERRLNTLLSELERQIERLEVSITVNLGPRYDSAGRIIAGSPVIICGDKVLLIEHWDDRPFIKIYDACQVPMSGERALSNSSGAA